MTKLYEEVSILKKAKVDTFTLTCVGKAKLYQCSTISFIAGAHRTA